MGEDMGKMKEFEELTEDEIDSRLFFAEIGNEPLTGIATILNREVSRAMRSDKTIDIYERLDKDAEWLKSILPGYIDSEVRQIKSTLDMSKDYLR